LHLDRRKLIVGAAAIAVASIPFSEQSKGNSMTTIPITFDWTVPAGLPAAGTVRKCFIMIPMFPHPDKRAVFYQWSAYTGSGVWLIPEPSDPTSQMLCRLGLYVIGIDQGLQIGGAYEPNGTYGAYRSEIPAFWDYVKAHFGCGPKISAFLRSRGGFWGNLAADTANFFDRMVGVGNITDGVSYDPIGIAEVYTGDTTNPPAVTDFNAIPSVACPTLPTLAGNSRSLLQQNSLNNLAGPIAASGVPMFFAYGTADTTVTPSGNALAFASNYSTAGGTKLTLFPVAGASHADITTTLYQPLIDWMMQDNPGETYVTQPILFDALAATQTIPGGVWTLINQQISVAESGTYHAITSALVEGLSGTAMSIGLTLDGVLINEQQTAPSSGTQQTVPSSFVFNAAAGQVIGSSIYMFTAGSFPLAVNGNVTFVQAVKLG
jgi:hypothetical protein